MHSDLVILSSPPLPPLDIPTTPPKAAQRATVPSTSSPGSLPSPIALLNTRIAGVLEGSSARQNRGCSSNGFQTVAGLVQQGQLTIEDEKENRSNSTTKDTAKDKRSRSNAVPGPALSEIAQVAAPEKKRRGRKPAGVPKPKVLKQPAKPRGRPRKVTVENTEAHVEAKTRAKPAKAKRASTILDDTDYVADDSHGLRFLNYQPPDVGQTPTSAVSPIKATTSADTRPSVDVTGAMAEEGDRARTTSKRSVAPGPDKPARKRTAKTSAHLQTSVPAPSAVGVASTGDQVDRLPSGNQDTSDSIHKEQGGKRNLRPTSPQDTYVDISVIEANAPEPAAKATEESARTSHPSNNASGSFQHEASKTTAKKTVQAPPRVTPTKRDFVEFVGDIAGISTIAGTVPAEELKEQAQSVKAPKKKKLNTVTALALDAYQPADAVDDTSAKISVFFKPNMKPKKSRSKSPVKKLADGEVATKKPRKRVRIAAEVGETPSEKKVLKKTPKKTVKEPSKKRSIAPNLDERGRLLPPEAAADKMAAQDFMFGTSSQLIREEDPDILIALRYALKESVADLSPAPENVASKVQRIRSRGLWSVAGDYVDEETAALFAQPEQLLAPTSAKRSEVQVEDERLSVVSPSEGVLVAETSGTIPSPVTELLPITPTLKNPGTPPSNGYKDIDSLSNRSFSISPDTGPRIEFVSNAATILLSSDAEDNLPLSVTRRVEEYVDISAFPSPQGTTVWRDIQPSSLPNRQMTPDPVDRPPSNARSISRISGLSPRSFRTIQSPPYQRQALRNLTTNASPAKRPRGRPPKSKPIEQSKPTVQPASTLPDTTVSRADSLAPDGKAALQEAVKRPRGRPRKAMSASPSTPKRKPRSPSRTAPQLGGITASPFRNISDFDDIEDSEPEASPSPPRGSQTHALATTKGKGPSISVSAAAADAASNAPSKPIKPRNRATATTPLPPTPSAGAEAPPPLEPTYWADVTKTLYPLITTTVKASNQPANPSVCTATTLQTPPLSWHEKMLLYDPIVIEDLTDWLNGEGVRVARGRWSSGTWSAGGKRKAAKKKTKDKAGGRGEGEGEAAAQQQPLEPWMVQRWCEEHSVCCLWRANLVGGGRKRH